MYFRSDIRIKLWHKVVIGIIVLFIGFGLSRLVLWITHPCDQYNALTQMDQFVPCCVETKCGISIAEKSPADLTESERECVYKCFNRGTERALDEIVPMPSPPQSQ